MNALKCLATSQKHQRSGLSSAGITGQHDTPSHIFFRHVVILLEGSVECGGSDMRMSRFDVIGETPFLQSAQYPCNVHAAADSDVLLAIVSSSALQRLDEYAPTVRLKFLYNLARSACARASGSKWSAGASVLFSSSNTVESVLSRRRTAITQQITSTLAGSNNRTALLEREAAKLKVRLLHETSRRELAEQQLAQLTTQHRSQPDSTAANQAVAAEHSARQRVEAENAELQRRLCELEKRRGKAPAASAVLKDALKRLNQTKTELIAATERAAQLHTMLNRAEVHIAELQTRLQVTFRSTNLFSR